MALVEDLSPPPIRDEIVETSPAEKEDREATPRTTPAVWQRWLTAVRDAIKSISGGIKITGLDIIGPHSEDAEAQGLLEYFAAFGFSTAAAVLRANGPGDHGAGAGLSIICSMGSGHFFRIFDISNGTGLPDSVLSIGAANLTLSRTASLLDVLPQADISYDLGTALLRWRKVYVDEVVSSGISGTYCCTAYNSGAQSIPDAVLTVLTFDSESFDVGGFHSTSVNTSRFTVPVAGKYLVIGQIEFAASAAGTVRACRWTVNGATVICTNLIAPHATLATRMNISAVAILAAGDYVEFLSFQNSGGALNADAGLGITFGSIVRVG